MIVERLFTRRLVGGAHAPSDGIKRFYSAGYLPGSSHTGSNSIRTRDFAISPLEIARPLRLKHRMVLKLLFSRDLEEMRTKRFRMKPPPITPPFSSHSTNTAPPTGSFLGTSCETPRPRSFREKRLTPKLGCVLLTIIRQLGVFRTMRSFHHRRTTAWFVVLAYVLASSLSALFHNHSHGCASCIATCGHEHHHSDDHHEATSAGHADDHHGESSAPRLPNEDDCLACRYVAQSAVVAVPMPRPSPARVVEELRVATPRIFIAPVHVSQLARAPPLG